MKGLTVIEIMGDSILKGIQVDPDTGKYVVKNDMDLEGLAQRHELVLHNSSRFGCTVTKAARLLDRMLAMNLTCDAVVMDFGGNDCDLKWPEIAANPRAEHHPAVELPLFVETYRSMIRKLRERGIVPILTNLPPLEPRRFFNWWCRDLNQDRVLDWLGGSLCNIYAHQENYSRAVEDLAREERVPLVDLRGAFLRYGHLDQTICSDGTHPNSAGQALIAQALEDFTQQWTLQEAALA